MRRRNRAGLKRIGLLALALVLALGAMGTAYSAWTEDLYINSTVQLGTLDIDIAGVSSTFVYKVPGAPPQAPGFPPDIVVHYVYGATDPYPLGTPIASAITIRDTATDADQATMTFSGLFPGIDFWADVELAYFGSIPARVSVAEIYANDMGDTTLNALWTLGKVTKDYPIRIGAWIDGELSTDDGANWAYIDDPLGLQLHQFDLVHIALHVRLPEAEQFQNLANLGFTGNITVVQYNEYKD